MNKKLLVPLVALPMTLGGCVALAGAGLAAADYYADDNDVCNAPDEAGLIDSDCDDDD